MATQTATATDRAEQWEASIEPEEMLDWLEPTCPSPRKLRLFACACVRTQWVDVHEDYQQIVFDAELYADGLVPYDWLSSVQQKLHISGSRNRSTIDAYCLGHEGAWDAARLMQTPAYGCPPALQAHLLRDVIGNPFKATIVSIAPEVNLWLGGLIVRLTQSSYDERLPDGLLEPSRLAVLADALEEAGYKATIVSIAPEVNLRLGGLIVRLAQAAYDQRLPDGLLDPLRLAVLADALEEAGCQGESCRACINGQSMVTAFKPCPQCGGTGFLPHPLLAHLRSPGPHARGCWALDLLLGKS